MRWLACVVVLACGKSAEPTTTSGSGSSTAGSAVTPSAAPAPKLVLARCAPAKLAPRAAMQAAPAVKGATNDSDRQQLGQIGARGQGGGVGIGYTLSSYKTSAPTVSVTGVKIEEGTYEAVLLRRYVLRQRPKIAYCFEREQASRGDLDGGKLVLRLVIDSAGRVVSATGAGVDGAVSGCATDVMRSMEVPKPKAEGLVKATVSLQLRAADAQPDTPTRSDHYNKVGVVLGQPKPKPKPAPKPAPPPAEPRTADVAIWTPYATSSTVAPDDVVQPVADALATAIPTAALETCFTDAAPASLRAILYVAFDGAVIKARVGGSGDASVGACIAAKLVGTKVAAPPVVVEVACDFDRGDPQPWRITTDGAFVVDVSADRISHAGAAVADDAPLVDDKQLGATAFAVVIDPAAPLSLVDRALVAASDGAAALVAVKVDAGAPIWIGMGPDGRVYDGNEPGSPVSLDTRAPLHACYGTTPVTADDPNVLLGQLRDRCATTCRSTLMIGLDGAGTAKDLVALAGAARRAGFERILLGGAGCPK